MSKWVRFAEIKTQIGLELVLRWYGVEHLERSGTDHYRGACPLHRGQGRDAFHVNVARNLFHCFACGVGGNVLDFVAAMEQCSVREAALRLQERHGCSAAGPDSMTTRRESSTGAKLVTKKRNSPLGFCLTVNGSHPYLAQRGINPETAAHFGVGFYGGPGLMSGRVAIPIHDPGGCLVAYAGRVIDGNGPRYRFPDGFQKSLALFNYHRARQVKAASVIVVEGFFDCMRVHQAGFSNVIGLMGVTLSPYQQDLLAGWRHVILLLDGDETGRAATARVAAALSPDCAITELRLAPGTQPDQMTNDQIQHLGLGMERGPQSANIC